MDADGLVVWVHVVPDWIGLRSNEALTIQLSHLIGVHRRPSAVDLRLALHPH
jgi:hypothetical protein